MKTIVLYPVMFAVFTSLRFPVFPLFRVFRPVPLRRHVFRFLRFHVSAVLSLPFFDPTRRFYEGSLKFTSGSQNSLEDLLCVIYNIWICIFGKNPKAKKTGVHTSMPHMHTYGHRYAQQKPRRRKRPVLRRRAVFEA